MVCILYSQFRISPNTANMSALERCLVSPWSPSQSAQISDSVSRAAISQDDGGLLLHPPRSNPLPRTGAVVAQPGTLLKTFIHTISDLILKAGWHSHWIELCLKNVYWRNNIKLTDKSLLLGLDIFYFWMSQRCDEQLNAGYISKLLVICLWYLLLWI